MGLRKATAEEFGIALREFSQAVGWSMEFTAIREAGLMSRDSITFTPPLVAGGGQGETKQAELTGKAAVDRDIRSIFTAENDRNRSPAAILLNRMGAAAKMRNMTEFNKAKKEIVAAGITFDSVLTNKIAQDADTTRSFKKAQNYFNQIQVRMSDYGSQVVVDMKYIHDRLKYQNRQGRTKVIKNQGEQKGRYLVSSKAELSNYIKLQQTQVGKLKAGWWNVIVSLPTPTVRYKAGDWGKKGVAGYVKKFPGVGCYLSFKFSEHDAEIVFANPIGDNDGVSSFFRVQELVYGTAISRIEKDLDQLLGRRVEEV
jgi:hypothetical protein